MSHSPRLPLLDLVIGHIDNFRLVVSPALKIAVTLPSTLRTYQMLNGPRKTDRSVAQWKRGRK